jgi:hypothetical protein
MIKSVTVYSKVICEVISIILCQFRKKLQMTHTDYYVHSDSLL